MYIFFFFYKIFVSYFVRVNYNIKTVFIYRFFREDCLTFEMSSGSAGKDSESGSHFQPGLRRPLQSTQEKLQNGLGMISKFRISSVFCTISNIFLFFLA